MFSSFRNGCQGGTANYAKPLAGLALALAAGTGIVAFEIPAAHLRYRYNPGLQLLQKLHYRLFSLLGRTGEIYLRPSSEVPAQSRILKRV